jgi:hypothetical protein
MPGLFDRKMFDRKIGKENSGKALSSNRHRAPAEKIGGGALTPPTNCISIVIQTYNSDRFAR